MTKARPKTIGVVKSNTKHKFIFEDEVNEPIK